MKDVLGNHFGGPIIPFGSLSLSVTNPSIWKESFTWTVLRIRSVRGVNLEGLRIDRRLRGVGDDGRIGNLFDKIQCEEVIFPKEGEFAFPIADGRIKTR